MENTENQYPTGCYMEVNGPGLEKATKDGWRLVLVLERPGAGASFLVRTDKSKASELERLREELGTAAGALAATERELDQANRIVARTNKDHGVELLALQASAETMRVAAEGSDTREARLRERVTAYELTLDKFRDEVGRARCATIEGETPMAASSTLYELEVETLDRACAAILTELVRELGGREVPYFPARNNIGGRKVFQPTATVSRVNRRLLEKLNTRRGCSHD